MLSVALLSQFEPTRPVQLHLAPTCSSLGSDLLVSLSGIQDERTSQACSSHCG